MADCPRATYRLQLTPEFGFAQAAELVGYLSDLGVSHLYLSPILTAVPGSTHGYDVADPTTVSVALGGEEGLRALAATAAEHGLGLVVDLVPNHLGVGAHTPLWDDLLASGPHGEAARFFDVAWDATPPGSEGRVILPVLGAAIGAVLDAGELEVRDGRVHYYEHSFPVRGAADDGPGEMPPVTEVLARQHYRLVHWRAPLVNYRRFFAINDLAGVRVEDDVVFERTHAKLLELVADGVVAGLRVDHPDGLRDPARYFDRLARRSGGAWTVAEKILSSHGENLEQLPDWPVAGTTGYEFCNDVLGLFVDPLAQTRFTKLSGVGQPYSRVVDQAKRQKLATDLAPDLRRLAQRLWVLSQDHPHACDVGEGECLDALAGVLVGFDVYRTYVDPESGAARPEDLERVRAAVAGARAVSAAPEPLLDLVEGVLSGQFADPGHLELLARFQQLSGALMAKGVEDTALYRHRRLLALNEVGGDPSRFGLDLEDFHERNRQRAQRHPHGMVTTATHDTKRGEDVRLRIAALTELSDAWQAALQRWGRIDRTAQLVYQTMVGAWPPDDTPGADFQERVVAYVVKALREAGQQTSWTDPDTDFEQAAEGLIAGALSDEPFLADLRALAHKVNEIAMVSGLAQVLLRVTAPGVPDTYQGNELWDDSLVDPDNRRPADFARRRAALAQLDVDGDPAGLLAARRDGRIKLWVLSRALRVRRRHPDCFTGAYTPLPATGVFAEHVVAYTRTAAASGAACVTVAPRLPGRVMASRGRPPVGDDWVDTAVELPDGDWHDALTGARHQGGRLPLSALLSTLPVALLVREG